MDRRPVLGVIGRRLALAFVSVALAGVGVLGALTFWAARTEVSSFAQRQQDDQGEAVVGALAAAYEDAGGWERADLRLAVALATSGDAVLEVRDATGRSLVLPGMHMGFMAGLRHGAGEDLGPPRQLPVVVSGTTVGTAVLRFPAGDLPAPEQEVRDALVRRVVVGTAVASLLALAVAVAVSRRITRPLVRLTAMAKAMEAGDLGARAGQLRAPGELGELADAADRMAEALAREDTLRRTLVADVAHELRTPVTILQAYCEEMVEGVIAPTPDRIASLHDEVLRLARMVEDLETLAHAEAAALRLDRRRVDLAGVVEEAAELLRPRFDASEVELTTHLEPVMVDGDPLRLNQVVTNLLTNAVKFTPAHGRVTVVVDREGPMGRLVVSDTGPGIGAHELPHVFERFWRGRLAGASAGSGVGLAVVAELVRAHHGRVDVVSPPGQGARFTVLLPATP